MFSILLGNCNGHKESQWLTWKGKRIGNQRNTNDGVQTLSIN